MEAPATGLTAGVEQQRLRVEIEHTSTLNFAMEQSGAPIVSAVRVENVGSESIEGAVLSLSIDPSIATPTSIRIPRLRAGESKDLGVLDVRLEPGRLRGVREAERAALTWEVRAGTAVLASGRGTIDVLAFNEWAGLRAPPALLATFVTPNDPVVAGLLRRVRDRLRATTGDGSLAGYQPRSPLRVRETVIALYRTIQSLGVSYISAPASFEDVGQKVRLTDAVLAECMGNCLDVSVLFASCLEQMALSPVLVIQREHAFPGVWLVDECFHEGVVYDAARLRNAIALGQLLVFDSSTAVADPPVPFEAAERVASSLLARDEDFRCVVDVPVARRDRYRPLPTRALPVENAPRPPGRGSDEARAILHEAAARPLDADETAERDRPTPPAGDGRSGSSREPVGPTVARFKQWRDRLLDLSLRNKLLNFRPETRGSLALEVPDIARFEDLLAADQTFRVQPAPDRDPRDVRDAKLVSARSDEVRLRETRVRDLEKGVAHCPLDEVHMLKHAVHLEREARTAREEGGANVLYVAIGLLKWFESDASQAPRLAPLLLVPVALDYVRTTRVIRITRLAEESMPNATLVEKMKSDFGLDLSALANVEPDDSGLDVPAMLRGVRAAIQRMNRWEVLEEAHLGLFSFTKFLMWKDLGENQDVLLQNDVIRHIATRPNEPFPDRGGQVAPDQLDDEVPPARVPLVVDADSTQTAAVVAALGGRSFVLQGPPGTGKSQTITNLIAAALADGQSVLFVSEKMAALGVVYQRLRSVGLGDFCLELHSHKAQKRQVVQSLAAVLDRAERVRPPAWQERSGELAELRSELNAYVRAIHQPRRIGLTFQQASARLLRLASVPEVRVSWADILEVTPDRFARARAVAGAFGTSAAQVEPVATHPLRECAVDGWSAQRDQDVRDALRRALDAARALEAARAELSTLIGAASPVSLATLEELARLAQTVAAGPVPRAWKDDAAWQDLRTRVAALRHAVDDQQRRRAELARRWSDGILDAELEELAPRFARWASAFFVLAWLVLLSARRRLRPLATAGVPGNRQVAADLTVAREAKIAEAALLELRRAITTAFDGCGSAESPTDAEAMLERGAALRTAARQPRVAERAAVERVLQLAAPEAPSEDRAALRPKADTALAALQAFRAQLESVGALLGVAREAWPADGPEHVARVVERLEGWLAAMPAFRAWALYRRAVREMRDARLEAIADAHRAGSITGAQAAPATERAILSAWTIATGDRDPVLRDFDGKNHHRLVERFRDIDAQHIELARKHVAAAVESRLPSTSADVGASSEPGILRREIAKKARHMPLRKLLQQVPNLLVRLKPCLLMSPLSVAQFLPAKGKRFDLVVFDEASQICTHDAIGAIGRGTRVVVVGDSKQLPPTAFFQRAVGDEEVADENDFAELESILDEALAVGLPEQMLGWHYRSRHEALIQFSNTHYYDDRLSVFPAARGRVDDLGVKFHHVADGVYEAGKSRTNPREARALVAVLLEALRTTSPNEKSFGVVTFSAAQQELVEDLLNEARRDHPEIEPHFSDDHPKSEKVFVKNLENVQGDERDEILFSVAYGPAEHGKRLMNFGPLNRDGGERRLNVAVTRARRQLRVFASITHDWIDTARARSRGAAHLKSFLRYAADQAAAGVARRDEPVGEFDSDFERDVHDVLRASGYRVDTQVGCGAYRIDLAVVHPDRPGVYAIGVECDGAAYHSGATARDRDRLRQGVLEGLGWQLHRIWSTDWFYDRANEIDRLVAAVEAAVRRDVVIAPEGVEAPVAASAARETPSALQAATTAAPAEPVVDAAARSRSSATQSRGPFVPYRRSGLEPVSDDPEEMYHPVSTSTLRTLVERVVRDEAPIHVDELARRVAGAYGAIRLTGRVRSRIRGVVEGIDSVTVVADVVWARDADRERLAVARVPTGPDDGRDPEMIPPEEIGVAAGWVLSQSFSMPMSDLLRETARAFGIQRLGAKVEERMRAGVSVLIQRGLCVDEGARAVWRGPESGGGARTGE